MNFVHIPSNFLPKIKTTTFLLFLFWSVNIIIANAQISFKDRPYTPPRVAVLDTAEFKVTYQWIGEDPVTTANRTIEYCLLIGPRYSKFTELSTITGDSLLYAEQDSVMRSQEWEAKLRRHKAFPDLYGIYRNHQNNEELEVHNSYMLEIGQMVTFPDYYYIEQVPEINWTLTGCTKTIGGIECGEATARVRGRDWTVWYAESYPYFEGPWELVGAPGLIVEAYDSTSEHQFTLMDMRPDKSVIVRQERENKHEVSRKKMRELRSADEEKPLPVVVGQSKLPPMFKNHIDKE